MHFTIGIITYQRDELFLRLLRQLADAATNPLAVVVLDNNDVDSLRAPCDEICDGSHLDVTVLWDGTNHGVAAGRNLILDRAEGDAVIFLDDDAEVVDLALMLQRTATALAEPDVAGCAFDIVTPSGDRRRHEIPHADKSIDMSTDFDTYLLVGAGHAVDIEATRALGAYPAEFGIYGVEETELAFKMINAGHRIRYLAGVTVVHHRSDDGRMDRSHEAWLLYVNRCKLAVKWFSPHYVASNLAIWSGHYLRETRDLRGLWRGTREILGARKLRDEPFGASFYRRVRDLGGRLVY